MAFRFGRALPESHFRPPCPLHLFEFNAFRNGLESPWMITSRRASNLGRWSTPPVLWTY